ncbi:MAG: AhpC/TSA family protein, partial [Cyclobacteriaceae bacterium]|nr:AhpC/TSA family protein [Cyclobacteriaceae bacterium]
MKINKLLILGITVLFACSGGSGQETEKKFEKGVVISGTVGYPQAGIIQLEKIENNEAIPIDTIVLDKNQAFSHQVEVTEPGYFRLNFYNKQQVVLILSEDDLKVTVDGNTRGGFVEIEGSRDHDLVKSVQGVLQSFQTSPEMSQINALFAEAQKNGDSEKMDELREQYLEMEYQNKLKVAELIKNSVSLAVIELLRSGNVLDADRFFDVYESVSSNMIEKYPDVSYVVEFKDKVEGMRKLAIGQIAPEIELPNPDGQLVKLSSLRGNYVLLDFWAKWCGPCRQENPNVVRMYKKYNAKGF